MLIILFFFFFLSLILMFGSICSGSNRYRRYFSDLAYHGVRRSLVQNGLLKINTRDCEEMLAIVDRVCQQYKVEFWLSDGTALGAVREQRILPGDTDVDICMSPEYWPIFHDQVVPELVNKYGFIVFKDHLDFDFITLVYKDQDLDVNPIVPGGYCSSVPGPCDELIPHIGTLHPVQIGSATYKAPSNDYLEFLYGPTWRIPKDRFKPEDARKENQVNQ